MKSSRIDAPPVPPAHTAALADDDLRIVRALLIDPRVTFATMASVLGLSEPTISRRYGHLRRTGALRVTGVTDTGALGQSQWTVRLRCRPGSTPAIAESLARREDVSWVAISAAGTEVTCALRSRSRQTREDLLGRRLPRASAVLDVRACVVLHKFLGGRGRYWAALSGVLTPEQEARLGSRGHPFTESATATATHPPPHLSEHDEALLTRLGADGRASLVDLGAAADLTPGRVSRRLTSLVEDQVVHLHVEVSPEVLGFGVQANLWLKVQASAFKAVGGALAELPEVGYAAAVSGRDNVHAQVHCRDLEELFELVSDRVGTLPGVGDVEIDLIQQQVKRAGALAPGPAPR